jgi:hemolysin activation/secretion protein
MRKLITLSLATTSLLLAAAPSAPGISDVMRETTLPKDMPTKSVPLIEVGEKYAPAMKEDKSGKTVFVKAFKITGALHMDASKLQELIASYTNKELTFTQLEEAASVITKAYREAGYFVARAYIPVQSMKEGTVEIAIIEGNYGEFRLNNTSLVNDSVIQGMLDDVKDENIVSTDTLERAMLIINDTPGAKVTQADVMPGTVTGTSDFAIKTEATPRYDGYIIGDNYGSRYTGYNRLMAGLNLNSLAGIGDKLSLMGMVSNGADLKYGRIAYSAPLMSNGLRGEVSYSNTHYSLTDAYTYLDAYGTAESVEGELSYPLIRTRHETLNLTTSLASKDLVDHQNGAILSDKDATVFTLGANYAKDRKIAGAYARHNSSVTLTCGNLKFNDATSRANDAAGADTQGRYNKLSGYVREEIAFNAENSLSVNLQFQKALGNKNLDGSEDFVLGGTNGVKVYPTSELSAEEGIMLNTELFQNLPTMVGITQKVGLFHDIGKVTMADSSKVATFQSRTLQDIGIGYYASYEGFFAKAQLARIIGGGTVTSENDYHTKLLIQAGWSF